MSIGNLKDQGNKGNNFPYQLRTLQLLDAINQSISALPGVDYETRTTTYKAIVDGPLPCNSGTSYCQDDIIVRYDIINVATSTVAAVIWFNQTAQTTISGIPAPATLEPINAPSSVTVINAAGAAAVNIQDGGNSITVDNVNLDIPLSDIHNKVSEIGYTASAITTTALTVLLPGPVTVGESYYITSILVTNSHATVGTLVNIEDNSGNIIYTGYAAPAGGGYSVSFALPLKVPGINEKVNARCGTTGANVYVTVTAYTAL